MTKAIGNKPKNIRERNFELILNLYRECDTLSVTEIASAIHLSRTTVQKINEKLIRLNLITTSGKGSSTNEGGKKPNIFRLNREYGCVFCVHIKYDLIHASVINIDFTKSWTSSISITRNADLPVIMDSIRQLYENYLNDTDFSFSVFAFAIAVHGVVNSREGICSSSTYFPSWGSDSPFCEMVSQALSLDVPVYIDSWIRYKSYAEKEIGTAKNMDNFLLIDAGTHGVTGALTLKNSVYTGRHLLAGEIGHITVKPDDERKCVCGGRGCLESMISVQRLLDTAKDKRSGFPDSVIFSEKQTADLDSLMKAFLQDDELAANLMSGVARWLAIGLNNIYLLLDPEVIIFEGDYARGGETFLNLVRKYLRETSMIRTKREFNIIINEEKSISTLTGAAAFAIDEHFKKLKTLTEIHPGTSF